MLDKKTAILDTDSAEKKEETAEEKLKELQRKQQKSNRLIQDLKGDLNRLNIELQNNRRRLTDATRRADTEREKKNALRRDIETMEAQLKSERRRFAQELEQMEKKRKMDEIRYVDFVSDSFGMDYGGDRRNLSKNSFIFLDSLHSLLL